MTTLLNLDTNRNEIIYDRTYYHTQSPASSVFLTGSESDSRNSSSPSVSEYSCGDSSNGFAMETLKLTGSSPGAVLPMETDDLKPYLKITEQPIDKFRFRYKSEMHGTHGCLTGSSTNKVKRTFPSVQLMNFDGEAIIRCSLFQVDSLNHFHHSHSLMVRKDSEDIKDPHDVEVSPSKGYTAIFVGMGIIHTAKKYIVEELHDKLVHRMMFEKGREITQWENQQLRTRAENEAKNMNLNKVCLCFEAFQLIEDTWVSICEPVLTNAINNMKCALTGELRITRLSTNISEASGNEDVFLFVEKVGKKNIKVRFYEVDENDEPVWEDWGRFSEVDVHHQYAIALRTPPYRDKDVEEMVHCFIQLVRPSDQCVSDPKPFRYKPTRAVVSRKRARVNTPYNSAELPTTINEAQTISAEFNKSAIIADVTNPKFNSQSENLDSLLSFWIHYTTDDLESLIDPAEFIDSKELSKELRALGTPTLLRTDGATTSNAKETSRHLGPELLVPLMHKIIIRNSKESASEKIRNLFAMEYENNRFILDFLVAYNPTIFKHFLTFVEKLGIADVLDYQNDRKKSCFHIVCENCTPETITDIVPTLIRLGANPNLTDDKGDTVLHLVIREDNLNRCADVFIKGEYPNKTKLDMEIENDDSLTPLQLATRLKRIDIVHSLLNAGASVHGICKKDGNSILHIAVDENCEELVVMLLNKTAIDVTRKNHANQTPIELATAMVPPNCKILDLLKKKHHQGLQSESHHIKSDDSDEQTENFFKSHKGCERFDRLLSFVTNKIPFEIKEEPYDDISAYSAIMSTQDDNLETIDDICLDQLCEWFNKSNRWKRLARCMDLEAFVNVWAASRNPSKMLFKFSEVQGITCTQIVDIFKQINELQALQYIDEMVARKLEEDD